MADCSAEDKDKMNAVHVKKLVLLDTGLSHKS
jgi:hypothetical protein